MNGVLIRINKIINDEKDSESVHISRSQSRLLMFACLQRLKKTSNDKDDSLHSHNVDSPGVASSNNRFVY